MKKYASYWKNYFNFSGKATRSQYWIPILINFLISFILLTIAIGGSIATMLADLSDPIGAITGLVSAMGGLGLIASLFNLATLIPSLSVLVRRLHDINMSGWLVLLMFIPIIGSLILFILTLLPSK